MKLNRKGSTSVLIVALMLVSMLSMLPVGVGAPTTTLRFFFWGIGSYDVLDQYTDPLREYIEIFCSFTVEWIVEDVTDLTVWGCGISWDPAILECTSAAYGPAFKSVDPACLQMPFTVDNAAGTVAIPGEGLTAGAVSATVYPDAAILFVTEFRVVGFGQTWLNWTTPSLLDSELDEILPRNEINGYFNNIDLVPPPFPPTADFTFLPVAPFPGVTVTFDASGSTGGWDGANPCPINRYWWDWENDGVVDDVLKVAPSVGDIDGDGVVFTTDLLLFANAWASEDGDPNWDPRCDFDGDGIVFTVDLLLFAGDWCAGMDPPYIERIFTVHGVYNVNLTVYAHPSPDAYPEYHPYDNVVMSVVVF